MDHSTSDAVRIARGVRLLLFDVDGVLTDGHLLFGPDGGEYKSFDARDGIGFRLAKSGGLLTGIITARESEPVRRRTKELQIDEVHLRAPEKLPVYEEIKSRLALSDDQCAFVGDDLLDLPVILRAGLGVTVADAPEELRNSADLVTNAVGGRGAAREVIEFVLKSQGKWDDLVESFRKGVIP